MHNKYEYPLISVVTVCYNSEKTIEKTIQSILSQTNNNYEYIVVDGKSTDRTIEIVESYIEKFDGRLKYISEKDSGIYNAMNKGIKRCNGDIIGILNSDDYYSNNTLELVAKKYADEKYPLLIINGDMERINGKGDVVCRYRFSEEQVKSKSCFGHPSMFAAKAVYDRIGLYDETYKLAADGEWQYRAHEAPEVKYILVHEVFNHMREGGASDNFKYRWKWFSERVRMKKCYKKGSTVRIYWQEFKSVIRTDIKSIVSDSMKDKLYKWRYRKKKER